VFGFEITTDEVAVIDGLDTGKRGGPESDTITPESFGRPIPGPDHDDQRQPRIRESRQCKLPTQRRDS